MKKGLQHQNGGNHSSPQTPKKGKICKKRSTGDEGNR